MPHVIANCLIILLLSSALPLLARTLGITNFDLLGDYGKIGKRKYHSVEHYLVMRWQT